MTERLIQGYQRFRNGFFRQNRERLTTLAERQSPRVAMVACCDSRVDPAILFDAEPGEIFVIRNVANLVPPFDKDDCFLSTRAALEFAVTGLKVEHLVVLGHAHCGGIRALIERHGEGDGGNFVDRWMQIAEPAKKEVMARDDLVGIDAQASACERAAVRYSLRNLTTYPWICERIASGKLTLIGWYYDLRNGELTLMEYINSLDGIASDRSKEIPSECEK
jgi:carbonic anhydrase